MRSLVLVASYAAMVDEELKLAEKLLSVEHKFTESTVVCRET